MASCMGQEKDSVFCDQRFYFTSNPIPKAVLSRMTGKSLPEKALINVRDLRYLTLPYYDFDGNIRLGTASS